MLKFEFINTHGQRQLQPTMCHCGRQREHSRELVVSRASGGRCAGCFDQRAFTACRQPDLSWGACLVQCLRLPRTITASVKQEVGVPHSCAA